MRKENPENPNYFKLAGVKILKKCATCLQRIGLKSKNNKVKRRVVIQRLRKAGMTKSEVDAALEGRQLDEVGEIDQKSVADIVKIWETVREDKLKRSKPTASNPRNLITRKVPQTKNVIILAQLHWKILNLFPNNLNNLIRIFSFKIIESTSL